MDNQSKEQTMKEMNRIVFALAPLVPAVTATMRVTGAPPPILGSSTYEPYTFTTLAGLAQRDPDGIPFYGSADGTGSTARFYSPQGVAVDSAGNVYVADTFNHTIRRGYPTPRILTVGSAFGFNGGQFGFNLTGPAERLVVVEASTDLVNWLPLWTNTFTFPAGFINNARAQEVAIPDLVLKSAIWGALDKPNPIGALTVQDMLSLTNLNASRPDGIKAGLVEPVKSLEGLGAAHNLIKLYLSRNELTSLTLPDGLSGLTELDLSANSLTNLTLPVGLTNLTTLILYADQLTSLTLPPGLSSLATLSLFDNPLKDLTLPERHSGLHLPHGLPCRPKGGRQPNDAGLIQLDDRALLVHILLIPSASLSVKSSLP
jgi:hypothetical protein